jgi:hypothetical protein
MAAQQETPPNTPQRARIYSRQTERNNRIMDSPQNRRTPAQHPVPHIQPLQYNQPLQPAPPDVADPFGVPVARQYNHLPAHLAQQLAALQPLPPNPASRQREQPRNASFPPPVPILQPPLPPPIPVAHQYNHLPPHLAQQLANLPPVHQPRRRARYNALPPAPLPVPILPVPGPQFQIPIAPAPMVCATLIKCLFLQFYLYFLSLEFAIFARKFTTYAADQSSTSTPTSSCLCSKSIAIP